MRCTPFMSLLITTHVLFVLAHIYRHSQFVQETFRHQKNERLLEALTHKRQELASLLYSIKDRSAIREYAQQALHMKPLSLAQVKKLERNS